MNSFGYGGANAHTILESIEILAPGRGGVRAKTKAIGLNGFTNGVNGANGTNGTNGHGLNGFHHTNGTNGVNGANGHHHTGSRHQYLLPLSAHNEQTLKENVSALREQAGKYNVLDLAYTLGCRRSKLASRSFVVASQDNIPDALNPDSLIISKATGSKELNLGFVFTGNFSISQPTIVDKANHLICP